MMIMTNNTELKYKKGNIILQEGQNNKFMYRVEEGTLHIFKGDPGL